jgi:cellulase/cellobiase CelA1
MPMMTVFHSNAPWVVGGPTLLEHALEEFDSEITRQTPWLRAQYAAVLERLQHDLDLQYGQTPLTVVTNERLGVWLGTLPAVERGFAVGVIRDLQTYLIEFAWVDSSR